MIISRQVAQLNCRPISGVTTTGTQSLRTTGCCCSCCCKCIKDESITMFWPATDNNKKKGGDEYRDNNGNSSSNKLADLKEAPTKPTKPKLPESARLAARLRISNSVNDQAWLCERNKTTLVATKPVVSAKFGKRNALSKLVAFFATLLILSHLILNDFKSFKNGNQRLRNDAGGSWLFAKQAEQPLPSEFESPSKVFKFSSIFLFQPVSCSSSFRTLPTRGLDSDEAAAAAAVAPDRLETTNYDGDDEVGNNLRNRNTLEFSPAEQLANEEYSEEFGGTTNDELSLARNKKVNPSRKEQEREREYEQELEEQNKINFTAHQIDNQLQDWKSSFENHRREESELGDIESNDKEQQPPKYRWPFIGLVGFMFIGATGNILVCMAICRERRLQTATNYFLLSLALADLLVCTLVMPFGIIYEFYGKLSQAETNRCTLN